METIIVRITRKGSRNALPAIWYGGKAKEQFTVIKSKEYPSFYEVTEGEYKNKIIQKRDCTIVK